AGALLDIFAAQLLGGLACLDEQGERRIFVVNDLLVLEQLEEAIVGNVLELRIISAPEEHRQRKKAEGDRDQDDAAPVEARLVAAGLVLALGVTIGLCHKGCDYGRGKRLPRTCGIAKSRVRAGLAFFRK